jgi:hypothetical protein
MQKFWMAESLTDAERAVLRTLRGADLLAAALSLDDVAARSSIPREDALRALESLRVAGMVKGTRLNEPTPTYVGPGLTTKGKEVCARLFPK